MQENSIKKTPETIFTRWKNTYDMYINYDRRGYDAIIDAMKEFGKQEYNRALDDAVENISLIHDTKAAQSFGHKSVDTFHGKALIDKQSILKLKQ